MTATGVRTKFGRTAELVSTAHVISSQQVAVVRVVRNLVIFAGCVIVVLALYAAVLRLPLAAIIPLVLTAVLGSIPVALPATFTLAAAIGATGLAKHSVLPTRLAAVDEAGTMNVLCADKTGTLTKNALTVASVHSMPGFDNKRVLTLAALASSDGGQDPVDAAIRAAAGTPASEAPRLSQIRPFRSFRENVGGDDNRPGQRLAGETQCVVKGAYAVVSGLAQPQPAAAIGGKRIGGAGIPRAGRGGGTGHSDGACRSDRPERPSPQRFGRAGERIAGARRAHRNGDRGRAANSGDRRQSRRLGGRRVSVRVDPQRGASDIIRRVRRRASGRKV